MTQILSERGRDTITVLYTLAQSSLRRLNVAFTRKYLEESLVQAYVSTLEVEQALRDDGGGNLSVVDVNDATNVAIVLLEALKRYHIKNEVVTLPVASEKSCTLAILAASKGHTYRDLLELLDASGRLSKGPDSDVESYVVLTKTPFSGEPGYALNRRRETILRVAVVAGAIIVTAVTAHAFYRGWMGRGLGIWTPLLMTTLGGLFVCYHLWRVETTGSYASSWVKKLCSNIHLGFDCKQVLSSSKSSLYGLISMTDAGAIFFATMLVLALMGMAGDAPAGYLTVFAWCSIASLPYSMFLLYEQVVVIETRCALCLMVHALLWIQTAWVLVAGAILTNPSALYRPILLSLLAGLIVSVGYYSIVQNAKVTARATRLAVENHALRNSVALFNGLTAQQAAFGEADLPAGALTLGNPGAHYRLTTVLSGSCSPCASKLLELRRLADWFGNGIGISILLKPERHTSEVVRRLLKLTLAGCDAEGADMLTDWYEFLARQEANAAGHEVNPAERWSRQRPMPEGGSEQVDVVYRAHEEWHRERPTPHTPFIAYNGRALPSAFYNMEVLRDVIEKTAELEQAAHVQ